MRQIHILAWQHQPFGLYDDGAIGIEVIRYESRTNDVFAFELHQPVTCTTINANPMIDEMAESSLDLVLAGTQDAVMMVESEQLELKVM